MTGIAVGLAVLAIGGVVLLLLGRRWTAMSAPRRASHAGPAAGLPAGDIPLTPATTSSTFQIGRVATAGAPGPATMDAADLARLVLQDGRTTVDLDAIPDPDDRRRARGIIARLLASGGPSSVNAQDLLWLAGLLSRK